MSEANRATVNEKEETAATEFHTLSATQLHSLSVAPQMDPGFTLRGSDLRRGLPALHRVTDDRYMITLHRLCPRFLLVAVVCSVDVNGTRSFSIVQLLWRSRLGIVDSALIRHSSRTGSGLSDTVLRSSAPGILPLQCDSSTTKVRVRSSIPLRGGARSSGGLLLRRLTHVRRTSQHGLHRCYSTTGPAHRHAIQSGEKESCPHPPQTSPSSSSDVSASPFSLLDTPRNKLHAPPKTSMTPGFYLGNGLLAPSIEDGAPRRHTNQKTCGPVRMKTKPHTSKRNHGGQSRQPDHSSRGGVPAAHHSSRTGSVSGSPPSPSASFLSASPLPFRQEESMEGGEDQTVPSRVSLLSAAGKAEETDLAITTSSSSLPQEVLSDVAAYVDVFHPARKAEGGEDDGCSVGCSAKRSTALRSLFSHQEEVFLEHLTVRLSEQETLSTVAPSPSAAAALLEEVRKDFHHFYSELVPTLLQHCQVAASQQPEGVTFPSLPPLFSCGAIASSLPSLAWWSDLSATTRRLLERLEAARRIDGRRFTALFPPSIVTLLCAVGVPLWYHTQFQLPGGGSANSRTALAERSSDRRISDQATLERTEEVSFRDNNTTSLPNSVRKDVAVKKAMREEYRQWGKALSGRLAILHDLLSPSTLVLSVRSLQCGRLLSDDVLSPIVKSLLDPIYLQRHMQPPIHPHNAVAVHSPAAALSSSSSSSVIQELVRFGCVTLPPSLSSSTQSLLDGPTACVWAAVLGQQSAPGHFHLHKVMHTLLLPALAPFLEASAALLATQPSDKTLKAGEPQSGNAGTGRASFAESHAHGPHTIPLVLQSWPMLHDLLRSFVRYAVAGERCVGALLTLCMAQLPHLNVPQLVEVLHTLTPSGHGVQVAEQRQLRNAAVSIPTSLYGSSPTGAPHPKDEVAALYYQPLLQAVCQATAQLLALQVGSLIQTDSNEWRSNAVEEAEPNSSTTPFQWIPNASLRTLSSELQHPHQAGHDSTPRYLEPGSSFNAVKGESKEVLFQETVSLPHTLPFIAHRSGAPDLLIDALVGVMRVQPFMAPCDVDSWEITFETSATLLLQIVRRQRHGSPSRSGSGSDSMLKFGSTHREMVSHAVSSPMTEPSSPDLLALTLPQAHRILRTLLRFTPRGSMGILSTSLTRRSPPYHPLFPQVLHHVLRCAVDALGKSEKTKDLVWSDAALASTVLNAAQKMSQWWGPEVVWGINPTLSPQGNRCGALQNELTSTAGAPVPAEQAVLVKLFRHYGTQLQPSAFVSALALMASFSATSRKVDAALPHSFSPEGERNRRRSSSSRVGNPGKTEQSSSPVKAASSMASPVVLFTQLPVSAQAKIVAHITRLAASLPPPTLVKAMVALLEPQVRAMEALEEERRYSSAVFHPRDGRVEAQQQRTYLAQREEQLLQSMSVVVDPVSIHSWLSRFTAVDVMGRVSLRHCAEVLYLIGKLSHFTLNYKSAARTPSSTTSSGDPAAMVPVMPFESLRRDNAMAIHAFAQRVGTLLRRVMMTEHDAMEDNLLEAEDHRRTQLLLALAQIPRLVRGLNAADVHYPHLLSRMCRLLYVACVAMDKRAETASPSDGERLPLLTLGELLPSFQAIAEEWTLRRRTRSGGSSSHSGTLFHDVWEILRERVLSMQWGDAPWMSATNSSSTGSSLRLLDGTNTTVSHPASSEPSASMEDDRTPHASPSSAVDSIPVVLAGHVMRLPLPTYSQLVVVLQAWNSFALLDPTDMPLYRVMYYRLWELMAPLMRSTDTSEDAVERIEEKEGEKKKGGSGKAAFASAVLDALQPSALAALALTLLLKIQQPQPSIASTEPSRNSGEERGSAGDDVQLLIPVLYQLMGSDEAMPFFHSPCVVQLHPFELILLVKAFLGLFVQAQEHVHQINSEIPSEGGGPSQGSPSSSQHWLTVPFHLELLHRCYDVCREGLLQMYETAGGGAPSSSPAPLPSSAAITQHTSGETLPVVDTAVEAGKSAVSGLVGTTEEDIACTPSLPPSERKKSGPLLVPRVHFAEVLIGLANAGLDDEPFAITMATHLLFSHATASSSRTSLKFLSIETLVHLFLALCFHFPPPSTGPQCPRVRFLRPVLDALWQRTEELPQKHIEVVRRCIRSGAGRCRDARSSASPDGTTSCPPAAVDEDFLERLNAQERLLQQRSEEVQARRRAQAAAAAPESSLPSSPGLQCPAVDAPSRRTPRPQLALHEWNPKQKKHFAAPPPPSVKGSSSRDAGLRRAAPHVQPPQSSMTPTDWAAPSSDDLADWLSSAEDVAAASPSASTVDRSSTPSATEKREEEKGIFTPPPMRKTSLPSAPKSEEVFEQEALLAEMCSDT